MKLLGVDYGTKNIGLARASTSVPVALPFGIIDNTDKKEAVGKLVKIIQDEQIETVVAGLPIGLDGAENKNTERVRNFFAEVQSVSAVPIQFFSEVFSSQASDRFGGGASRDEKAAMIILQNYLDQDK
jgi:putative Holliday junction resolvase